MSLYYYIWISNVICPGLYCLLCEYWYNCSPSCLRFSFHNHISHRIDEYKRDHWLSKLMFCKLQYGIPEGIWYLQSSKSCQVVECPWLDWCILIAIQITTTYEIRTKYNDNLRPNKYTESQKTKFVQPEPTYRRRIIRKRKNKSQTLVHIRKLKF